MSGGEEGGGGGVGGGGGGGGTGEGARGAGRILVLPSHKQPKFTELLDPGAHLWVHTAHHGGGSVGRGLRGGE